MKICWLSAGVSSFMAGYLCGDIDEWIYIDVSDQHKDSMRFIHDIEKAIDCKVTILKSEQYDSVEECVLSFGGFKNPYNQFAPCTNYLKKRVRKQWENEHQGCDLIYVWGFDYQEKRRAERTIEANPQARHEFPLIDKNLSKEDVHGLFERKFNFNRPIMYDMGYPNNNCIGCVKGGAGYWNRIRKDFPDVFDARARLERKVGYSILKDCYLDELDPNKGNMNEIFPECGIMCYLAE